MGKVFLNKQFSNYLGENRAILDTVVSYVSGGTIPTPTPSVTPTITPTVTVTSTSTPTPTPTVTSSSVAVTPTPTPSPTPSFNTEYTAILSRAATLGFTPPNTSEQNRQNQLITDLKNAGLWSKLGSLYMFAMDTTGGGSPGFTFINWVTPSETICSLSVFSGTIFPTHQSLSGWTMGQTNRVNIGVGPGSTTVNPLVVNLSGMTEGCYVADKTGNSTSGSNVMWTSDNNQWNRAFYNNTTGHQIFRDPTITVAYDFQGLGFKAVTNNGRPDTSTTIVFTNDNVQTTRTKTGTDAAIASASFRLNGTAASLAFSWTCSLWFSGRLNTTETASLNTIFDSYLQ